MNRITLINGLLIGMTSYMILKRIILLLNMYYTHLRQTNDDQKRFIKAIFFPDSRIACFNYFQTSQGCQDNQCMYAHEETSQEELISFMKLAKNSLELCIYIFTCPILSGVVLQLHKKGVIIRIITDKSQSTASDSEIGRFREEGILVRCHKSTYLMHHKFILVDRKILITGSFNWTAAATLGNHENLLITNYSEAVIPFVEEFCHLWQEFDPCPVE